MENNKEKSLVEIVKETGVINPQAELIISTFKPMFENANEIILANKDLVVKDENDIVNIRLAKESRANLRAIRISADEARGELKADALKYGNAVQGVFNLLKKAISPVEEYLESQEKFAENIAKEKAEKLKAYRTEQMSFYVENTSIYNFDEMSDEAFSNLLEGVKVIYEKKQEEIIENEKSMKALIEKENLFQERKFQLAPYSFFFGSTDKKLTIDSTEEDFKSLFNELVSTKKQYDIDQAELVKTNARLEMENKEKDIIIAKEKEIADAKLKKIEDEKKKLEHEMHAAIQKEQEERKAEIEKERQAKLAPDEEKLKAFANALALVEIPRVVTPEANETLKQSLKILSQVLLTLRIK